MTLEGEAWQASHKTCPTCNGKKEVDQFSGRPRQPSDLFFSAVRCRTCRGRGWV